MSEPILLVRHNPNGCSVAPHGAGRDMSRRSFKDTLVMLGGENAEEDFYKRETEGLDVRWFSGEPDITELGGAYKSASHIRKQIAEHSLADVFGEIQPLGCVMAGE